MHALLVVVTTTEVLTHAREGLGGVREAAAAAPGRGPQVPRLRRRRALPSGSGAANGRLSARTANLQNDEGSLAGDPSSSPTGGQAALGKRRCQACHAPRLGATKGCRKAGFCCVSTRQNNKRARLTPVSGCTKARSSPEAFSVTSESNVQPRSKRNVTQVVQAEALLHDLSSQG